MVSFLLYLTPFGNICIINMLFYKTCFLLNSAEHEIYPAHKCSNANSCWHFNFYCWHFNID